MLKSTPISAYFVVLCSICLLLVSFLHASTRVEGRLDGDVKHVKTYMRARAAGDFAKKRVGLDANLYAYSGVKCLPIILDCVCVCVCGGGGGGCYSGTSKCRHLWDQRKVS